MTRTLPFRTDEEIARAVPDAVRHVQADGLLVYPTETVYGLGGAVCEAALDRVYAAKGRAAEKTLLLLIGALDMLTDLGLVLDGAAHELAAALWPGPLTLVLSARATRLPPRVVGPTGGVAVRWTPHAGLQRLLGASGAPLTSTSANRGGEPPQLEAAGAAAAVIAEKTALLVLDGGPLPASPPSTVVDCTGPRPHLRRMGAMAPSALYAIVPATAWSSDL